MEEENNNPGWKELLGRIKIEGLRSLRTIPKNEERSVSSTGSVSASFQTVVGGPLNTIPEYEERSDISEKSDISENSAIGRIEKVIEAANEKLESELVSLVEGQDGTGSLGYEIVDNDAHSISSLFSIPDGSSVQSGEQKNDDLSQGDESLNSVKSTNSLEYSISGEFSPSGEELKHPMPTNIVTPENREQVKAVVPNLLRDNDERFGHSDLTFVPEPKRGTGRRSDVDIFEADFSAINWDEHFPPVDSVQSGEEQNDAVSQENESIGSDIYPRGSFLSIFPDGSSVPSGEEEDDDLSQGDESIGSEHRENSFETTFSEINLDLQPSTHNVVGFQDDLPPVDSFMVPNVIERGLAVDTTEIYERDNDERSEDSVKTVLRSNTASREEEDDDLGQVDVSDYSLGYGNSLEYNISEESKHPDDNSVGSFHSVTVVPVSGTAPADGEPSENVVSEILMDTTENSERPIGNDVPNPSDGNFERSFDSDTAVGGSGIVPAGGELSENVVSETANANNSTYRARLGASAAKVSNAIKGAFENVVAFSKSKFNATKDALNAIPGFMKGLGIVEKALNHLEKHPNQRAAIGAGMIVVGFLFGGGIPGAFVGAAWAFSSEVAFRAANAIKNQISPSDYYKAQQAQREPNQTTEQQEVRIQNIERRVERIDNALQLREFARMPIAPVRGLQRRHSEGNLNKVTADFPNKEELKILRNSSKTNAYNRRGFEV